jgi:uroporphyrinogen-III synthase
LRPWRGSSFTPATATAAALAKALPDDSGRRVLFPASALAAPTLEEGLKERNFAVTRVDAYTTAPAPWSPEDAAAAASADVVAVGSPSAARVWAARASVNVRAACVGATSADACVELGFGRDRVFAPAKPGLAGWAGAVRDAVAALA